MSADPTGSWQSAEYVGRWAGEDLVGRLLETPLLLEVRVEPDEVYEP